MTISSSLGRKAYAGDGVSIAFATQFKFFENDDVKVILQSSAGIDSTLTKDADYTIVGAGNELGGTVTLNVAPAIGETLNIILDPPRTQNTDYVSNDAFPAESHERALDRVTQMAIRTRDIAERTLRQVDGDYATLAAIPGKAIRAGMYLAFDANGDPNASTGTGNDTALREDLAKTDVTDDGALLVGFRRAEGGSVGLSVSDILSHTTIPQYFGAVADGSTDDRAAFNAANVAAGTGSIWVPKGTYRIGSDLTISRNIQFDEGAVLVPDAGVTVTINAWIQAGDWQIFDTSALNSLVTGGIRNHRLLPEWWGALGDNSNDDTVAIQACARAAYDAGMKGVQLLAKTYRVTNTIFGNGYDAQDPDAPSWYGIDKRQTIIRLDTATAHKAILRFEGGSGTLCGAVVQDIQIVGNSTSRAIEFSGKCGMKAVRCRFHTNLAGLWFHNQATGAFTEYCVGDSCEFTTGCNHALNYQKDAGASDSFHGSGLINRCTHNIPPTGMLAYIAPNAKAYNCPLDVQVWVENTTVNLILNDSTLPTTFHGQITYELQSGGVLTLAATNNVWFSGVVVGAGESVSGGKLYRTGATVISGASAILPLDIQRGFTMGVTTGANILSGIGAMHRMVWVRFSATNYDYRYLLSVEGISGGAGAVTTVATIRTLNTAGYGAPTFSVNASGQLVATNAGWPASGVTARWYESQLSVGDVAVGTLAI